MKHREKLGLSSIGKKKITRVRVKSLAAREMILNFSQYFFHYENTNNTMPPGYFVNCTERNSLLPREIKDEISEILESRRWIEGRKLTKEKEKKKQYVFSIYVRNSKMEIGNMKHRDCYCSKNNKERKKEKESKGLSRETILFSTIR